MGFLDSIIGSEKDSQAQMENRTGNPLLVSLAFSPLRLSANNKSSVDLLVKIKNVSSSPHMVSVDAAVPRNAMLGFDPACINKAAEKKAGELKAGEILEIPITIWSSTQTKEGTYPVDITVYSHFMDYTKVLHHTKKSASLRAV